LDKRGFPGEMAVEASLFSGRPLFVTTGVMGDMITKGELPLDRERLEAAYQTALVALLAERTPEGFWVGELSTSALSTATTISALALVQKATAAHGSFDSLISGGLHWLAANQNADGGWGDTVKSFSNVSTTMLCRAAFHLTGAADQYADCLGKCATWLTERYGQTQEELAEAIRVRYGKDRTFSVPILMTSALAGLVAWREVPPLPFELAMFPQSWFRFLRLPVVSYALPALIAIGQAVHHYRPSWNPFARLARRLAIPKSLRVLQAIQPSSGGFLEAAPLTSFVTMGLASTGRTEHPVVKKCVEFLVASVRPDGSWPIDTNLSTWVTTLAVNALAAAGDLDKLDELQETRDWLMKQQYRERHPYTGADPGGWAWTPLPGGVPDADDTPGAMLALDYLHSLPLPERPPPPEPICSHTEQAARNILARYTRFTRQQAIPFALSAGVRWLLDLQNRDGGWPTFCRGWGNLPFDRSGGDLTAHVLRALTTCRPPAPVVQLATANGLAYLARAQATDGSWLPLWFGNQHAPDDVNPTYGTARVLAAYRDLGRMDAEPAQCGVGWLLAAQNADGGWGGDKNTPSSIEETALAVEVLLDAKPQAADAVERGLAWLIERIEAGGLHEPTPIGFYFAKLWYFEKLYPIIFAVAALGKARRQFAAS
jgi:squalene-hopene/tetraprenyl-beta-curcumene cyclase